MPKINGAEAKRLRESKGWAREDLARKAGCHVKTIENCENGRVLLPSKLGDIALALGVQPAALIEAEQQSAAKTRLVEVVLSGNDAVRAKALTDLLSIVLEATGEITIRITKGNSVVVTLEMTEADLLRLVQIFPDFHEHARSAIATLPEGRAFFTEENPDGLDVGRAIEMLLVLDRVRELRLVADQPPRAKDVIEDLMDAQQRFQAALRAAQPYLQPVAEQAAT